MKLSKFNPWNWFQHESPEGASVRDLPVARDVFPLQPAAYSMLQLHRDIDRLFAETFKDFGFPFTGADLLSGLPAAFEKTKQFRPRVDVASEEARYTISVEAPGLDETSVSLTLQDRTLVIRGEKRQEHEEKDKEYHRVERTYGAFERLLSLPEDADETGIDAHMKNGVLLITIPRKVVEPANTRKIEIKH